MQTKVAGQRTVRVSESMSAQSDVQQTNLTLFCMQAQENLFVWGASHLLMLGFVGFNILLMGRFWKLTGNFPVRERAPKIAMLQSTVYLFLILVIYAVEVLTNHNWVDWDQSTDEDGIPTMRKVFKAAYLTIRLNIYLVFLARTAVIYFRWTRKSSRVLQPNPYEQETELPATGIFRGLRPFSYPFHPPFSI